MNILMWFPSVETHTHTHVGRIKTLYFVINNLSKDLAWMTIKLLLHSKTKNDTTQKRESQVKMRARVG